MNGAIFFLVQHQKSGINLRKSAHKNRNPVSKVLAAFGLLQPLPRLLLPLAGTGRIECMHQNALNALGNYEFK